MSTSRRRFTQEFKDELCREVIATSKPIKDVAVAYGVGPEPLRNWLIKYREAKGLPVNNTVLCGFGGVDGVVPFAVEVVAA